MLALLALLYWRQSQTLWQLSSVFTVYSSSVIASFFLVFPVPNVDLYPVYRTISAQSPLTHFSAITHDPHQDMGLNINGKFGRLQHHDSY